MMKRKVESIYFKDVYPGEAGKLFCFSLLYLLIALVLLGVAQEINAQERLFLSTEREAALRHLINQTASHEQAAYRSMKKRVDQKDLLAAYPSGGGKYEPAWRAREAALVAILTKDKKYADLAYEMCARASGGAIDRSHNQPGKKVSMDAGYGLARAALGMNVAITYNWLKDIWAEDKRKAVYGALLKALDAWPKYKHANFGHQRASNWVAVCRGAELVMILATDQKEARGKRVAYLKRELGMHMKNGFGSEGCGQEGAGYIEYPGQFLLPACIAMAERGENQLLAQAKAVGWWRMVMYTYAFQTRTATEAERKFIQWGVAVRGPDEGWVSLLFHLVPEKDKAHYLWWYDRFAGRKANVAQGHKAFDAHRAGTTWSLIYYPSQLNAKDPTGVYPPAIHDSHGFVFARNQWRDESDILVMAASDDVHHRNAWDQPDNLALRLLAHNHCFISGPGKSRDASAYSGILINGKIDGKKGSSRTGRGLNFKVSDQGFSYQAESGELFSEAKVSRRTAVHFKGDQAIISTLDQFDPSSHQITWQANIGAPQTSDVSASTSREARLPAFTLKGEHGPATVKGWVIGSSSLRVIAGDPLKIETKMNDVAPHGLWVVLWVGPGEAPPATYDGKRIKIGELAVMLNDGRPVISET